jgi:hypothetical protein
MLHPVRVPPSAAGSLPLMFPRGIPSAALPAQSQVPSGLCSSRASRMLGSLSLASSGHLAPHGQPGGGIRPPGSAPLHRLPARRPPPCRRSSAPRPAASCFVPHTMPPAPKNPVATLWELRFGNVVRVVHVARSRGHLRALRRQALSSSLPALPHSYRRLCSLVIPAGALDPAPCGGKEHLSVLRSQNPVCTGFAKHRQRSRGITANPSGTGRSRLGKHGSSRHLLAAAFVASTRHPHSTPAIPRPWPQRCGVSQNSSPRTARPHPRSTEPSGLPLEVPSF